MNQRRSDLKQRHKGYKRKAKVAEKQLPLTEGVSYANLPVALLARQVFYLGRLLYPGSATS
jgi:hypothetical protein